MAKEKSLKTLKIHVNKDGTLSKKSLEDIQRLAKPSVAEKIASRVTVHDAVEAAGFAGLVALNYYGIDLLGMFLGRATKLVEDIVETVYDFNTVVTEKYGEFGVYITGLAIATVPGLVICVGMPRVVVEETITEQAGKIGMLADGIVAGAEAGVLAGTMSNEELQRRRAEADAIKNANEDTTRRMLQTLNRALFLKKVAIATGMAYAEKKFLESYNYYKAVENIPLVE